VAGRPDQDARQGCRPRLLGTAGSRVRTHDEPSEPIELDDGRIAVHIDQTIRTPAGSPVSDGRFIHVYQIRDGLAARLDIESPTMSDAEHG